ncbi:MAG: hypothetical protein II723_03560 [Oscillospiraceae bacterium]|nr:hypothetical protein [Oscillospiraceae bacterium]
MEQPTPVKLINCPYCAVRMQYRGAKRIQLGKWGIITKHLSNYVSGALSVQVYECPKCGKIELFRIRK